MNGTDVTLLECRAVPSESVVWDARCRVTNLHYWVTYIARTLSHKTSHLYTVVLVFLKSSREFCDDSLIHSSIGVTNTQSETRSTVHLVGEVSFRHCGSLQYRYCRTYLCTTSVMLIVRIRPMCKDVCN